MSEKLIEGFSMEEAFKALNEESRVSKKKVNEAFGRGASTITQQMWQDELNGECGEISDRRRAHLEKKFAKQREYERKQAEKAAAKEVEKADIPEVEEEPAMVESCCNESVVRISKSEMEKLDKEVEEATKEVAKYNIPMKSQKNSNGAVDNVPDFDAVPTAQREAAKHAYDRYSKAVSARPDRAKCKIEYIDEMLTESYSNEMTQFMNWIQEYRNGALWDDFTAEFEAEQDPDIDIVLNWLEVFDKDAYYDYIKDDDIDEMLTESLSLSWLDVQNQIALEQQEGINPFYDESAAGNYVLELMGKVETELDVEVVSSVQGGYGDVYIHLGDTYADSEEPIGPFNFTEFSNEMINLVLEADTESAFIDTYRKDILAYIETDESLNESTASDYYEKIKSETKSTNTLSDFIANVKLMQDVLELDDIADFYDSFEEQIYDQFLTIDEFINNNIPDATSWNLNHEDNEVTVITPDGEIKLFIEADDGAGIDVDFIDI